MTDSDLYLIAHRVRGESAFDIATQMPCPECSTQGCDECDDTGFWWVVPTSGHRAYPYAWQPWHAIDIGPGFDIPMPNSLPDHYLTRAAPTTPRTSLAETLGLNLRPASAPIKRRV